MTTALATPHLQLINVASISPNVNNPRKHFDKDKLKELADSIAAHGVLEPIVVRPDPLDPKKSELIIGERRWRASKLAKIDQIPALIRDVTDREALEMMVIENDQREDTAPLDRARGYKALLDQGMTVAEIHTKTGKSERWVYAIMKLLDLIPAAAGALDVGIISLGHATLIARLTPIDQVRALDASFHRYGGNNERELRKLDPAKVSLEDLKIDPLDAGLMSEKALREWIYDNINLRLKDVPWKLDDANLLPSAGPCTTCPKRSTSNPGLFAELAVKNEDTCFDAVCFQEKRLAFVQVTIQADKAVAKTAEKQGDEPREVLLQLSDLHAWNKPKPDRATYREGQWLPAKPGSCVNVRRGILIRGEHQGQIKSVCIDQSCKVHKHNLSNPTPRSTAGNSADPAKLKQLEEEKKRERELDQAWEKHLDQLLSAKADGPDRAALLVVAEFVDMQTWGSPINLKKIAKLPLHKAWTTLVQEIVKISIEDDPDGDAVKSFAASNKLDLAKLEKEFRAKHLQTPAAAPKKAKGKK